ncbi:hypothetical protein IFM89_011477 [Coptis chinensis]|uniref:Uncharacterized protein n=1 Tax=Coptis chinensis TaxID=261450 RepID=A0A835IVI8_9MAGN|nr:hypothetical protein IFM89_011477 [Coptis chinensis]
MYMQSLYVLGARKFVVFSIPRLGCAPGVVNSANPKPAIPWAEDVNSLLLVYNTRLPSMITNLQRDSFGSTFVPGDAYGLKQKFSEAGINTVQIPCCQVRADGMCVPDSTPCLDRTQFIFYDAIRATDVAYKAVADACFSGFITCAPLNIQQLAQKQ